MSPTLSELSEAQRLFAEILNEHQFVWDRSGTWCRAAGCDWRGGYRAQYAVHQAQLIDAAFGGLTRETVREQVPYGDSTSGVMPTAWKKPRIRHRWVSVGWSEVQS